MEPKCFCCKTNIAIEGLNGICSECNQKRLEYLEREVSILISQFQQR